MDKLRKDNASELARIDKTTSLLKYMFSILTALFVALLLSQLKGCADNTPSTKNNATMNEKADAHGTIDINLNIQAEESSGKAAEQAAQQPSSNGEPRKSDGKVTEKGPASTKQRETEAEIETLDK